MVSLCMVIDMVRFNPCTDSLPRGKKYDDACAGTVAWLQMY